MEKLSQGGRHFAPAAPPSPRELKDGRERDEGREEPPELGPDAPCGEGAESHRQNGPIPSVVPTARVASPPQKRRRKGNSRGGSCSETDAAGGARAKVDPSTTPKAAAAAAVR